MAVSLGNVEPSLAMGMHEVAVKVSPKPICFDTVNPRFLFG